MHLELRRSSQFKTIPPRPRPVACRWHCKIRSKCNVVRHTFLGTIARRDNPRHHDQTAAVEHNIVHRKKSPLGSTTLSAVPRKERAMENKVRVKVHAPSGTIILERAEKRNALSRLMLLQLRQAFEDLHQERKVRAVILTGAGDAFCAGTDIAELHATYGAEDVFEQWHRDSTQYQELVEYMLRFPKPIIAAVNGPAVAAGAGLVLASDIVLATPDARFGFPEPRRGIVAGVSAPLLAFRIGAGRAANLLLSGRLANAEEALAYGVYHRLVEQDMVWAAAHDEAIHCAQSSAEALQLTKRMLNETIGEQLGTLLSAGAAVSATSHTTEAAEEGLKAFVQKRDPNWP